MVYGRLSDFRLGDSLPSPPRGTREESVRMPSFWRRMSWLVRSLDSGRRHVPVFHEISVQPSSTVHGIFCESVRFLKSSIFCYCCCGCCFRIFTRGVVLGIFTCSRFQDDSCRFRPRLFSPVDLPLGVQRRSLGRMMRQVARTGSNDPRLLGIHPFANAIDTPASMCTVKLSWEAAACRSIFSFCQTW